MADEQVIPDGPLVPPRADEPVNTDPYRARVVDQELLADREFQEQRQPTAKQAWTAQIEQSVGAKIGRSLDRSIDPDAGFMRNIGNMAVAITGSGGEWSQTDWDRGSNFDALTKDVPREFWEDIFDQGTLAGAERVKSDIIGELRRKQTLGMSSGLASASAFAGALVDIDAPLALVSGGSLTGAKVAGRMALKGRSAGAIARASGIAEGLEAGALIGVGEALHGQTSDWSDAAVATLGGAAMGAAAGQLAGVAGDLSAARHGLVADVRSGEALRELHVLNVENPAARVADTREVPSADTTIVDDGVDLPEFRVVGNDLSAAAAQGPTPAIFPALKDPLGRMSDESRNIITAARKASYWNDTQQKIAGVYDSLAGRLSTSRIFNVGTSNVMALFKSKATTANYLVSDIFEMPGGQLRGGAANAAQLQQMYERRIQGHIGGALDTLRARFAASSDRQLFTAFGKKLGANKEASTEFARRVYLDMNSAIFGRARDADQNVNLMSTAMSNAGQEAAHILKGRAGEIAVDGADQLAPQQWYFPYRWNPNKMAQYVASGQVSKKDLVQAFTTGYLNAGQVQSVELANIISEAIVGRMIGRAARIDDSMLSVFSKDGREFLRETLEINGLSKAEIDGIMTRFDGEMAERGKIGSLKHRNDIDFDVDIGTSGLKIVDMLRMDLDNVMTGYTREVAGSAALARKGIKSRAERKAWREAIITEQRALGEDPMDGDMLDAMFSTFDGGPEWGWSSIGSSGVNKGIGAMSEVRSLASLSVLQLNGIAQLAETGVGIVSSGLRSWNARGFGRFLDRQIATSNDANLRDLAFFMGQIGQDQRTLRAHLSIDESLEYHHGDPRIREFMTRGRDFLDKANYLQGYTSGLNHVRKYQQEIAVLGMMDRVLRTIRTSGIDAFKDGERLARDLGISYDMADRIKDEITKGTVVFGSVDTKLGRMDFVDRLNLQAWPEDLAQDFAAALNRSMNQTVQHAMPGETDRWMHTVWGSAITHLQTFPILAVQKQFFRHAQAGDREAVMQGLTGVATAYMALYLRDKLTGKERTAKDRTFAAVGYSNLTGWLPMYTDPIAGLLGMNDLRFNQFGANSSPLEVPALDIFANLWGAPGSALKLLSGDQIRAQDRQNLRAIPFFRVAESAARMGSFGLIDPLAKDN